MLNPTVVIPDVGCTNTIECESPKLPPRQLTVVIPAVRVTSWCCAFERSRITSVFKVGDTADVPIPTAIPVSYTHLTLPTIYSV